MKVSKICYIILKFDDRELFVANGLRTLTVILKNAFAGKQYFLRPLRIGAIRCNLGHRDTNLNAASRIFANDSEYFRHSNPISGQYQTSNILIAPPPHIHHHSTG